MSGRTLNLKAYVVDIKKHFGVDADFILGHHPELVPPPGPPLPNLPLKKAAAFNARVNSAPQDLFTHLATEHTNIRCHPTAFRFVRRNNDREMLIYVDGSCLDQNSSDNVAMRRAGCAWVYKPAVNANTSPTSSALRLEAKGPTGEDHPQTSNRAELRAVLGVLQFRKWYGEGWQKMVIATDSEYVFLGMTERIEKWAERKWRTGAGQAVKNIDLWRALLERVNDFAEQGTEVLFWKIPRELNADADRAAKEAALKLKDEPEFMKLDGVLV